ncbi:unnamed protein product [Chilo suppressalis]|uniref:Uncharacterized protein n=1 Tax=Chilo suppressalis TaxID=168631 RepID=A0ABN8B769_CHISP|nr:unnamed protein product [Chilo suppressalis]
MIMLFKGNSSRLEHLIEKIQANKENHDVIADDIKEFNPTNLIVLVVARGYCLWGYCL